MTVEFELDAVEVPVELWARVGFDSGELLRVGTLTVKSDGGRDLRATLVEVVGEFEKRLEGEG